MTLADRLQRNWGAAGHTHRRANWPGGVAKGDSAALDYSSQIGRQLEGHQAARKALDLPFRHFTFQSHSLKCFSAPDRVLM